MSPDTTRGLCGAQSSLGAEVDTARLGLWGTSFAGGHVLVMAAKEGAWIWVFRAFGL